MDNPFNREALRRLAERQHREFPGNLHTPGTGCVSCDSKAATIRASRFRGVTVYSVTLPWTAPMAAAQFATYREAVEYCVKHNYPHQRFVVFPGGN